MLLNTLLVAALAAIASAAPSPIDSSNIAAIEERSTPTFLVTWREDYCGTQHANNVLGSTQLVANNKCQNLSGANQISATYRSLWVDSKGVDGCYVYVYGATCEEQTGLQYGGSPNQCFSGWQVSGGEQGIKSIKAFC